MWDSAPALIAPVFEELLRDFMTEETSQPGEEGNIHERVQALREKASDLSETFDKIEKTLQEAERETKD